jgi:hypothetical protein
MARYKALYELAKRASPSYSSAHRGIIKAGEVFEAGTPTDGSPPNWSPLPGGSWVCVISDNGAARAQVLPSGNESKLPLPPMPSADEAAVMAAYNRGIEAAIGVLDEAIEKLRYLRRNA